MNSTSSSLLERLRHPNADEAWDRFVRLYTPLLFHWARGVGLPRQDAADLVQDVLLLLVRKMPDFRYDRSRSFRAWLRTVTLNKWREQQRRRAGCAGRPRRPRRSGRPRRDGRVRGGGVPAPAGASGAGRPP